MKIPEISSPLGEYSRNKPLVFSFVQRCHGACGSGKYTLVPFNSSVIRLCWENSFPLSGVTVLHLSSPTFLSRLIIQSTTFLEIFFSTLPSREKRDLRSTRVTIRALPVLPATVSASQLPISRRSLAADGLSWILLYADDPMTARAPPKQAHDIVVKNLPTNLETLHKTGLFSDIRLYNREGVKLYSSLETPSISPKETLERELNRKVSGKEIQPTLERIEQKMVQNQHQETPEFKAIQQKLESLQPPTPPIPKTPKLPGI